MIKCSPFISFQIWDKFKSYSSLLVAEPSAIVGAHGSAAVPGTRALWLRPGEDDGLTARPWPASLRGLAAAGPMFSIMMFVVTLFPLTL